MKSMKLINAKVLNFYITEIRYNYLNLPSKITYSDGKTATYTYSTAGEKLSVSQNVLYSGWSDQYSGNFIYRNGNLTRVLVDGGYITFSGTTPHYHFYLRDHLGNNRAVVNASKTVEEVIHYYPYGGLFGENAGSGVQPYKYNFSIERGKSKLAYSSEREKNRPKVNGKELDRMNGLDLYDYGARYMDGALGRFTTIDPMCEKYYSVSPYAYCGGNPIRFIDIDGRWYWEKDGNLHAEKNDNTKTMADFLGTTQKDVIQILERNKISVGKNGKIDVENLSNLSLNKSSLYVMQADKSGIVLESKPVELNPYVDCLYAPISPSQTELAVTHYFWGHGEPADVGDKATAMLMNTLIFKTFLKATTTQYFGSGQFTVDMTGLVFHIGRTPVNYAVHHGVKSSHVDFHLFQYENGKMDSFSDPLDLDFEIPGGTKYDYKPRTVTFYFKPVK